MRLLIPVGYALAVLLVAAVAVAAGWICGRVSSSNALGGRLRKRVSMGQGMRGVSLMLSAGWFRYENAVYMKRCRLAVPVRHD